MNVLPPATKLIPTPASLTPLTRTSNFRARFSVTRQVLALLHFLYNPYHPLQRKLQAKYARQADEFVLLVHPTKKSISTKACVRTTIARRIRDMALTELREKGWKENGEVRGLKDHKGVGILPGGRKKYPLKGCLAFFPFEESITTPREELEREVKMTVGQFLDKHEKARIQALEKQLRELDGGGSVGGGWWSKDESRSRDGSRARVTGGSYNALGRGGESYNALGRGGESYNALRRGSESYNALGRGGESSQQGRGSFGSTGSARGPADRSSSGREGNSNASRQSPPRLAVTNWPPNRVQTGNLPRGGSKPDPSTSPASKSTTGGFRIKRM